MRQSQALPILGIIWLIGVGFDRVWVMRDASVPAWDQSHHLTGTLNYLHALQSSQFWSESWWHSFWILSHKYPPLTYILTGLLQGVIGTGREEALWVNALFTGVLLFAVYRLGRILFNPQIGLWSAGLCLLIPGLYFWRLQFLLDTPVTALTVLSFYCLTAWRLQQQQDKQWLWIVAFGVCLGLGLMTKQIILFFLFFPLLWSLGDYLGRRRWERVLQLLVGGIVSLPIWGFWYRTNWIYLFSTFETSNVGTAALEGDPALDSLAAWTYYLQTLPIYLSWELLLIPVVGLILNRLGLFPKQKQSSRWGRSVFWLGLYVVGSYLVCSAAANKDFRFIMPYLPIVAILLAYGLWQWRGKWQWVRWLTVGLATVVMVAKVFSVPFLTPMVQRLSPGFALYPEVGVDYPHPEVIASVVKRHPYLQSTLAVIPSVAGVNHNNINYYGALADFQVYGREIGTREEQLDQDRRNFHWFVTKTGDNGLAAESQVTFAESLAADATFQVQQQWTFPDETTLSLYQRRESPVRVHPLETTIEEMRLQGVDVPNASPAGVPVPVRYTWQGRGDELESGLMLLTWRSETGEFWIQDHAVGLGQLHIARELQGQSLQVEERTAMFPPTEIAPGEYTLEAVYYNPQTGEKTPLSLSPVTITIDPNAAASSAPPVDYVTQLRTLALELPKGIEGLEAIFAQIGRLNIYDPTQDYLDQAEASLEVRLQDDPRADWAYALTLAEAVQEDAQGAIAALTLATQLDPKNPYAYAYLAFVHLHQWQPNAAKQALQPALVLNPNNELFQGLNGVADVMQGRVFRGWRQVSQALEYLE
ncbi:MAG: phospholipid carrier-dependent glycosyltransferase [Kamptonema sp. SIO4C4]|nr:phospholipid carrier-dependent glycosyltransferase [Kamptonema sp. SIO4C4]